MNRDAGVPGRDRAHGQRDELIVILLLIILLLMIIIIIQDEIVRMANEMNNGLLDMVSNLENSIPVEPAE